MTDINTLIDPVIEAISKLKPNDQLDAANYFNDQLSHAIQKRGLHLTNLQDIATHFGVTLEQAAIIANCGHKVTTKKQIGQDTIVCCTHWTRQ